MEITHASITALSGLERLGNTRGSGDARGVSAAIDFKVDYHDLFAFLVAIEGEVEEIDTGAGTVEAKVPLRFPDIDPDAAIQLFADRYTWRSVGMRDAWPAADPEDLDPEPAPPGVPTGPGPFGTGWDATHCYAEVTVEFRRPEFNFTDSVFVSRRNRIGARVVTIPGAPYRYAPTASAAIVGLPINQDTGIIVPTQEIRLTRHWVPDIDAIEAAVHPLIYHTNDAPMTIGGRTWAAGCVLFAGFDSDEQLGGFGGSISRRVDYSVLVDDAGWDKVMSDITAKFEPVVSALDSNVRIYPRDDLSVLLTL